MTVVELTAHPGNTDPLPDRVLVTVRWQAARRLALQYRLQGDVDRLLLPAAAPASRTDELWRHGCCEAFVGRRGVPGYCEFNFSPSGQWAAYRFTARRQGMQPLAGMAPPAITLARHPGEVVLEAQFDPGLLAHDQAEPLVLGLAVVVEDREGRLSFWALNHAPGQPDFHDPGSFTLHLEPAGTRPPPEPAP